MLAAALAQAGAVVERLASDRGQRGRARRGARACARGGRRRHLRAASRSALTTSSAASRRGSASRRSSGASRCGRASRSPSASAAGRSCSGCPGTPSPRSWAPCCSCARPCSRCRAIPTRRPRSVPAPWPREIRPRPERDDFVRARVTWSDGGALLDPIVGQESHMIVQTTAADAIVHVPRGTEPLAGRARESASSRSRSAYGRSRGGRHAAAPARSVPPRALRVALRPRPRRGAREPSSTG